MCSTEWGKEELAGLWMRASNTFAYISCVCFVCAWARAFATVFWFLAVFSPHSTTGRDALLVFQTDDSVIRTGFTFNYASTNPAPTGITPTSFSVPENSPAGFVIGTFSVTGRCLRAVRLKVAPRSDGTRGAPLQASACAGDWGRGGASVLVGRGARRGVG
jgi:hypothetical protein